MKIHAAYIRVSTPQSENQKHRHQEESLPKQRDLLNAWFTSKGIPGQLEFFQDDRSGSECSRPGLLALIEAIENQRVATLWIFDDSRLARNQNLAQMVWGLCLQHEVTVWNYSMRRSVDLKNVEDRLMLGLTGFTNEFFLRQLRRQCRDGTERLLQKGCWGSGRVPFGYKRGKDKKLEPLEEEMKVVKRAFNEVSSYGLHRISVGLEADRVAGRVCGPRKNRPWTFADVGRIVRNPVYTGAVVWNRSQKGRNLPKDEWKVVRNAHPAVISEERFQQVQAVFRTRVKGAASFEKKQDNDIAGMAFCGHHGYMLVSVHKGNNPGHRFSCRALGCPNTLIQTAPVRDALRRHPAFRQQAESLAREKPSAANEVELKRDAQKVRTRVQNLEMRLSQMVKKFAEGEWTETTLASEMKPVRESIEILKQKILDIENVPESLAKEATTATPWFETKESALQKNLRKPPLRAVIFERSRIVVEEVAP